MMLHILAPAFGATVIMGVLLAALPVQGQPLSQTPRGTPLPQVMPTPLPTLPQVVPGPMIAAPASPLSLTPQAQTFLLQSLRDYLVERAARLPSRSALIAAGVQPENDAVEQSFQAGGRTVVPHHIGRAGPTSAPALATDPAALEGARAAARRRVGHDPSAAEIATDLAAFDARIATINEALAQRRVAIATIMKQTGEFPRELEAPILGVLPRAPEAVSPTPEIRAGLQAVVTGIYNGLASTAPPPVPR